MRKKLPWILLANFIANWATLNSSAWSHWWPISKPISTIGKLFGIQRRLGLGSASDGFMVCVNKAT